jgi:AcrR family transcriptional regulator
MKYLVVGFHYTFKPWYANEFMKCIVAIFHNSCYSNTEVIALNGFQRRREKKMKSILLAAYGLFSARGTKEVSMAEIAKEAGVSQVSIYNYFQSKENLVRQAIFAFMNEKMKESEKVLESKLSFQEKLEKLLFISDEADRPSSPEFFRSVMACDPLIQSMIEEYYQSRTEPFLMRLVEQGKKEGCIHKDLSDEAIRLYIGAMRNVLVQSNPPKNVRLDLDALFFYGLQGKI